jgi:hypothetical protein
MTGDAETIPEFSSMRLPKILAGLGEVRRGNKTRLEPMGFCGVLSADLGLSIAAVADWR